VHATRKTLEEAGDKVEASEKESIEAAIVAVEEAIKTDDIEQIEAKTKELTEASSGLAQKMYAEKQAEAGGADEGPAKSSDNDDAVDAEFEEVKDDK
jgi:molecular chaperone DnaK